MEFFEKLVEEVCGLLVEYRQLYWLRDFHPVEQVFQAFSPRSAGVPLRHTKVEEGELDRLAREVPSPAEISSKFDAYFADRAFKLRLSAGTFAVSLFESHPQTSAATSPFLRLAFPAWFAGLQRDGTKTEGDVWGISVMSTKSAVFVEAFIRVRIA